MEEYTAECAKVYGLQQKLCSSLHDSVPLVLG